MRTRRAPCRRRLDCTPHPRHTLPRHTLTLVDLRRSQLPPVLGGDVGVYIKWALILQEQLAHVQGERAGLAEQVAGLKRENEQLRQALDAGNTAGTATSAVLPSATPGAAAPGAAAPENGASGADAAEAAAGESADAQAQSTSDRTRTRSAALDPALPAAGKQAVPVPNPNPTPTPDPNPTPTPDPDPNPNPNPNPNPDPDPDPNPNLSRRCRWRAAAWRRGAPAWVWRAGG